MEKLTSKTKFSYGVGALGKDLAYSLIATFLMVYFTDVVKLNPAFVGTLFLVARMWDAINDPMMGMIVDNTRTKYGKFRPWILIGTIINAIILVFLFSKPDLEGAHLYAYFAAMYILWGMTYTIMDIPYWSMIPSLTDDMAGREQISVIPRIFASSAWLLMGALGIYAPEILGNGNKILGYERFAIIIAVIFVITSLITCINVKENVKTSNDKGKVTFKQTLEIIRSNDQLIVFIGIVLGMNLIMQISGGVAVYYFTYVIGDASLFSVFATFGGFAEITGLVLFPLLTKKISRKGVFALGALLPIIGFTGLFIAGIVAPTNALLIALAGIVLKLGSGMLLGSTTVMLADVVDYGEFKRGTRNESIIFSMQTLLVKTASAVSGWLVGVGLSLIGYVPEVAQSDQTILGMKVLMILLPILCSMLMYTIYKLKYKLHGKFYDDVMHEINKVKKI